MKKKTKKDSLATKKDLNKLASKVDFKNFRKEVLKIEARVEHLEDGQGRIETKLDGLESKVTGLDERTKKMNATLDNLKNTLDGFVGVVDNLRTDNKVGTEHTRKLRVQVDDHESRLTTLESS